MTRKKILMLGGSLQQVPVIRQAKEMGYYVITCDYLPDNPGHALADEYYNISFMDKDKVLALAKELHINGILAYASDAAAPTAAYVARELGLPGNPYESVEILTNKDLFRKFLYENNFFVPCANSYSCLNDAIADISKYHFPIMVKPVDASGSKGVVKVSDISQLDKAVEEALNYSLRKKIIIEEFVEKKGYQVSGDGFTIDGKLVFTSYGNELYSSRNGMRDYVALGEFWPSLITNEMKNRIDKELQRIVTTLGMKDGAYNIEVIIDHNDNIFVLEFAPRNGGSYIPQLIQYATGVNLVEYTIKAAVGELNNDLRMVESKGVYSNYMIFSNAEGRYEKIWFDKEFEENNLLDVFCVCKPGDLVKEYKNTTHSLGTIIFKADSLQEMFEITSNIEKYFKVVVS